MRGKAIRGSVLPWFKPGKATVRPAKPRALRPARPAGRAQGRSLGAGFGAVGGNSGGQLRLITPADLEKAQLFETAIRQGIAEANARTSFERAMLHDEDHLHELGF